MSIDVESLYNRRRDNRYDRVAVGDMLERVALSRPNDEAIVSYEGAFAYDKYQRVTYKEADDLANQFANALLAMDLERASRIVFVSENSTEAMVAKFGVAKAGMVNVPINPGLADDVIIHIVKLTEPSVIIADDEFVERLQNDLDLKVDVVIPIRGLERGGVTTFEEFVESQTTFAPELTIHGDDIWEILFTSGTTSLPKGAMISHHYTYMAAYDFAMKFTRGLAIDSRLKILSFISIIYHVGDQTLPGSAFLTGGTLLLGRQHDEAKIADMINEEGATSLWIGSSELLTSVVDYYEASDKHLDFSSVTNILYGYTPLRPEYHDKLKRIVGKDVGIWESFSQTESIGGFRFWHDEHEELYRNTAPVTNVVGKADPILGAVIVDDDGNTIEESGLPGEIIYRTPTMFSGYYLNQEETEKAFEGDWFHSGDNVMFTEDGLGIMVDRKKNIIKTGGESVTTSRVEGTIKTHADVKNAAVIGVPDERWGEMVVAFVVVKEDSDVNEVSLKSFVRERLAGFETPKRFFLVEELPESIAGKVKKTTLQDWYQEMK